MLTEGRICIKPTRTRIQIIIFGSVLCLFIAILAVGSPEGVLPLLVGLDIVVLGLVFWRASLLKLNISAEGVEVDNLLSSTRIGWDRLKTIKLRRPWRLWQSWDSGMPGLAFVTTDGKAVIADASINLNDRERHDLLSSLRLHAANHNFQMTFADEDFVRV